MTYHVPMCRWCDEHEVLSFEGGTEDFCGADCVEAFHQEMLQLDAELAAEREAYMRNEMGEDEYGPDHGDEYMSRYDDDPSVYEGTYSEM